MTSKSSHSYLEINPNPYYREKSEKQYQNLAIYACLLTAILGSLIVLIT